MIDLRPERLLCLSCSHCGAPLALPADTRYATCGHCGTRLVIEVTGGAAIAANLAKLAAGTDRMAAALRAMQLKDDLAHLDGSWAARERQGRFPITTAKLPLVRSGALILVGLALTIAVAAVLGNATGLVVLVVALAALYGLNGALGERDRWAARRAYEAQRADLVHRLAEAEAQRDAP